MSRLWIKSISGFHMMLVAAIGLISSGTFAQAHPSCRLIYSSASNKPWIPILKNIDELPQVAWGEILRPFTRPPDQNRGILNLKLVEGFLGEEKIFVKVSRARPEQLFTEPYRLFLNEVAWTEHLSDIGIGPAFKGVTITPDGQLAIVTEFIEGASSHVPSFVPMRLNFKLTASVFADLNRIKELIANEKIDAMDLEIRITSDRAYVVDPAYFKPATSELEITTVLKEIDKFILKLRQQR